MMITTKSLQMPAVLFGVVLFFSSCKTYYIPVDSFKKLFAGLNDSATRREVTTQGPFGKRIAYKTYPIDIIYAEDKKGNPVTIKNGPSIEVRITDTANKKILFYFDQLQFDGENIVGRPSRLVSSVQRTIPIGSVKTIEVQNGRKNFRYVQ